MEVQEIKESMIKCIEKYYNDNDVSFEKSIEKDWHLFLIDYFEVLRKRIVTQKRIVRISRELKVKVKSSAFKEWRKRFDEIKSMIENGDDLNPFLSKRAKESGFKDRLLTCWNMHHLHFYPEKKSGDMLLFVIVKDDIVYMIDVIPHSKKYVFSTFNLLNIVHKNWNFLLEPYRIKGATNLNYVIKTDEEVNQLRSSGVCTAVQLGADIYMLDTMSTDGHNSLDAIYTNQILNDIRIKERNGVLGKMKLVDFALTGKMKPCFILTYEDERHNLLPWII